jgi:hypothetical protein
MRRLFVVMTVLIVLGACFDTGEAPMLVTATFTPLPRRTHRPTFHDPAVPLIHTQHFTVPTDGKTLTGLSPAVRLCVRGVPGEMITQKEE